MQRIGKWVAPLLIGGIMVSCGEGGTADEEITQSQVDKDSTELKAKKNIEKVEKIFYAIPSPMETAGMLKESGADYNASLLNDVRNVKNYTTSQKRAINLGIYGADLSYTSVFNQNQESILYLSCAKQLADKLDLSTVFSDEKIERMETNVQDRDSLLNIVSETYYELDAQLQENDRQHISAYVFAGGWLEGLYIATQVAQEGGNPTVRKRIAQQKSSLDNLISLVEDYNSRNELDKLLADLGSLKELYDQVKVEKGEAAEKDASSDEPPTIGKKTSYEMSDDLMAKISEKVSQIRNNYIKS